MRYAAWGALAATVLLVLFGAGHARAEEEAPDPAALAEVETLSERVVEFHRAGKLEEAVPLATRCVEILERELGPDSPDLASVLYNLSRLYESLRRYPEAEGAARRALRILEAAFGPEDEEIASPLDNLGRILHAQGRSDDAEPFLRRAIAIRETTAGRSDARLLPMLGNLAEVVHALGRWEESRVLYERAVDIAREAYGERHVAFAMACGNMAHWYASTGRYDEARRDYERALSIREAAQGPMHPEVAITLNNLSLVELDTGAFDEARAHLERSLGILRAVLGPRHVHVAMGLHNLALLLQRQGAHEEALVCEEQSVAALQETLGSQNPRVLQGLASMAFLLTELERYEAAGALDERVLALHEGVFGAEHLAGAVALGGHARLLRAEGKLEEALAAEERALAIRRAHLEPGHPALARSLNNVAAVLDQMGRHREAAPFQRKAVEILEAVHGEDHPDVATGLWNYAQTLAAQDRKREGRAVLGRALDLTERDLRRRFAGLPPGERLDVVRMVRSRLDAWMEIAPRLGETGYAELLRFKGLASRASEAEHRLTRAATAAQADRVARLRSAERRLARLANDMPPRFRKAAHAKWQEAYAEASSARETEARALARDVAPYRIGLERIDIGLEDIQGQLQADEVLIDTLRTDEAYVAWILPASGAVIRVDLGAVTPVDEAIRAFSEACSKPSTALTEVRRLAQVVAEAFLQPILGKLPADVRRLILCPDGALAVLALAALPTEGEKTGKELLLDRCEVSWLAMAQDVVPREATPSGVGALLVGDVDYGSATDVASSTSTGAAPSTRAPLGRSFGPLSETRGEIEFVAKLMPGKTTTLFGSEATEAAFRTSAPGRRLLHLATHGFVREDLLRGVHPSARAATALGSEERRQLVRGYDPMVLAGLALAGASTRDGGGDDDGVLTALEVEALDLDGVDLVVLSACETARGRAESGEGILGLVRGFQTAGASLVLGSLWRVDDAATRALVERFHESRLKEDVSAAEALRRAQAHVRAQPGWEHPYYWAGWSLWGRR